MTARERPCPRCKEEKLAHYSERSLTEFYQFDGFGDESKGDGMIDPEGTGEAVMFGRTSELMHGPDVVRVLVRPGVPRTKVLALLDRIRTLLATDGLLTVSETDGPSCTHVAPAREPRDIVDDDEEIPF